MRVLKLFLILFCASVISCSDDDTTPTEGSLSLQFNHNWNEVPIDFNELKYTNNFGQNMSITKLRYLISNIVLHNTDRTLRKIEDYILVDLNNEHVTLIIPNIPFQNYHGISFTFGFNEADNIDGAYPDLNSESWNWPTMLGGGYHFMQLEGKYDSSGVEKPYTYHMGTARISTGVFEQNYFEVILGGFNFSQEGALNIHMNLAEWFTNPYDWNLETYNVDLMMNYDAQKLMNDNGKTVFSLGEIN